MNDTNEQYLDYLDELAEKAWVVQAYEEREIELDIEEMIGELAPEDNVSSNYDRNSPC